MFGVKKLYAAQLMFGLVELKYRYLFRIEFAWGGEVTLFFSFIFYLVRLWLGCIPRISFVTCLKVPEKFLWVVGGWWWWVL